MLFYGAGGVGKSTLLAEIAGHVWHKWGKKSRIIGADGGGYRAYKPLMDAGIVSYCAIDAWSEDSTFQTLELVSKGFWPEDVDTPDSQLLPPLEELRICPSCGGDTGARGLAAAEKCAACKVSLPKGIRLKRAARCINGFDEVGFIGFEGATAFGSLLLNRLRKADPDGGRVIKDGDFKIASLGKQHYGDAQNHQQQLVANSRRLPVPIVAWTALELRGDDDGYGKPTYGPAWAGKKLTSLCIPWFTDVIHVDHVSEAKGPIMQKDSDGLPILSRKLFLSKHFPEDTKPYGFEAKTSAPLGGGMPVVIDFTPDGHTMEKYFTLVDQANKKVADAFSAGESEIASSNRTPR